jgi:hypothetical protein
MILISVEVFFQRLDKNDDLPKKEYPLPWQEGIKGRGINTLLEFLDSSPSPLPCGVLKLTPQGKPSPIKGEGVFFTFYDFIKIGAHF